MALTDSQFHAVTERIVMGAWRYPGVADLNPETVHAYEVTKEQTGEATLPGFSTLRRNEPTCTHTDLDPMQPASHHSAHTRTASLHN